MVSGHGMLSKSVLFVVTATRRRGENARYAFPHSRNSGSTYRCAVHSGRPVTGILVRKIGPAGPIFSGKMVRLWKIGPGPPPSPAHQDCH